MIDKVLFWNIRRKLGLPRAKAKCSDKICVFWEGDWEEEVYARCSAIERLELWEDLDFVANANQIVPWMVGGDFNTIVDGTEKLWGLPVSHFKTQDFVQCINNCALSELKFIGSRYTWCNGRIK
ncbi:hypothetical protein KY285_035714 [Solanum tuberosum]|nr:hypothetical protein KY289_035928 [Solanum tuberosum]KAH0639128.1 hypothetical protein KY285_035714 [Solanum tuberosum]